MAALTFERWEDPVTGQPHMTNNRGDHFVYDHEKGWSVFSASAHPRRPTKPRATAGSVAAKQRSSTAFNANAGRLIKTFVTGEIVKELDGSLMCSCREYTTSANGFCSHIEDAIRLGLDAAPSGNPHADFVSIPENIEVPVFPRVMASLTASVGNVENDGSRAVSIQEVGSEATTLGWLWPGECRFIIRSMFLEWLRAQYHSVPNCSSRVHKGLAWTVNDQRNAQPQGDLVADIWSLLVTGVCSKCQEFQSFADDAPDF